MLQFALDRLSIKWRKNEIEFCKGFNECQFSLHPIHTIDVWTWDRGAFSCYFGGCLVLSYSRPFSMNLSHQNKISSHCT
jgi:hypothetical protein